MMDHRLVVVAKNAFDIRETAFATFEIAGQEVRDREIKLNVRASMRPHEFKVVQEIFDSPNVLEVR